jgi:hypothetical protein
MYEVLTKAHLLKVTVKQGIYLKRTFNSKNPLSTKLKVTEILDFRFITIKLVMYTDSYLQLTNIFLVKGAAYI